MEEPRSQKQKKGTQKNQSLDRCELCTLPSSMCVCVFAAGDRTGVPRARHGLVYGRQPLQKLSLRYSDRGLQLAAVHASFCDRASFHCPPARCHPQQTLCFSASGPTLAVLQQHQQGTGFKHIFVMSFFCGFALFYVCLCKLHSIILTSHLQELSSDGNNGSAYAERKTFPLCLQAMLKYDSSSREVRLTVDRDYKEGAHCLIQCSSSLSSTEVPKSMRLT